MKISGKSSFIPALSIQFLERLAYTIVLIQLPIYLAQKDVEKGLAWGQETKGWIFFVWAFIQNTIPIFAGILADKISQKKSLVISLLIVAFGYLLLLFAKTLPLFLIGIFFLGLGSGIFKPSLQGLISSCQSERTTIWAFYIFTTNLAFLLAGVLSKVLKDFDWSLLFLSSFILSLLNLLFVAIFIKPPQMQIPTSSTFKISYFFEELKQTISKREIVLIIGFTSCFALIYMQFYETLPNFIYDWTNTNSIARHLPELFTMRTSQGIQISYEWIYNLNPITIIIFILIVARLTAKIEITNSLIIGLILTIVGFGLSGTTREGKILLFGVIIYTFGEMIFNMKILELITKIAPERKKSSYFGILNISYTFGLCIGALSGGYFYKEVAEKYTLAKKFLFENANMNSTSLIDFLNRNFSTELLWNIYQPYYFWLPFILFGIFGLILLFYFKKIITNKNSQ